MTSKITFLNIKYFFEKSYSDITKTERSEGKLQAGCITSRFVPGLRIDVLVIKSMPVLTTDDNFSVNEDEIRKDTRRCFQTLSPYSMKKWILPVHTDFFKKIKPGDTIVVILHGLDQVKLSKEITCHQGTELNYIKLLNSLSDGKKTITDLSKDIHLSINNTQRMVRKLQNTGFVKKIFSGRCRIISLSDIGIEAINGGHNV